MSDRELAYEQLGAEIGRLVAEKQKAYGNSYWKCGEFLRLLYPDGIRPEQYGDMLALARVFDKQMRIATKSCLDGSGRDACSANSPGKLFAVAKECACGCGLMFHRFQGRGKPIYLNAQHRGNAARERRRRRERASNVSQDNC